MKHFIISILLLGVILISACKKKKHADPEEELPPAATEVTYPNYSKLKVGNYWIYQRFQIEVNGDVSDLHQTDSSYIEKDTLINSKTYFKLIRFDFLYNKKTVDFLKDSLHYIVDSQGRIIFSSQDFSTIFFKGYNIQSQGDTLLSYETKMDARDALTTAPAGSFNTSAMKTTFTIWPNYAQDSLRHRTKYLRYAKNTGIVSETEDFFLTQGFYREKRLVRYHLN